MAKGMNKQKKVPKKKGKTLKRREHLKEKRNNKLIVIKPLYCKRLDFFRLMIYELDSSI